MGLYARDMMTGTAGAALTSRASNSGHNWLQAPGATNTVPPQFDGDGAGVRCGDTNTVGVYLLQATASPATANQIAHARFTYSASASGVILGVVARHSAAANTKYRLYWGGSGYANALILDKTISGTDTALATRTLALTVGETYDLYLSAIGTAPTVLSTRIQRASDGQWLNASLAWVTTPADLHATTDSSITAPGFPGVVLGASVNTSVLELTTFDADDNNAAAPPPPPPSLTATLDPFIGPDGAVAPGTAIPMAFATRVSDPFNVVATWTNGVLNASRQLVLTHSGLTAVPHLVTYASADGSLAGCKRVTPA